MVLSKIYRAVDNGVFEDLAGEAVGLCTDALKHGAASRSSRVVDFAANQSSACARCRAVLFVALTGTRGAHDEGTPGRVIGAWHWGGGQARRTSTEDKHVDEHVDEHVDKHAGQKGGRAAVAPRS